MHRAIIQLLSATSFAALTVTAGAQQPLYVPIKWHPFQNMTEFTGQSLAILKQNQVGALLTRAQGRGGAVWTLQPVQLVGGEGRAHLGTPTKLPPDVRIFTAPSLTYPKHYVVIAHFAVGLARDSVNSSAASASPPALEGAIPVQQLDAVISAFTFRTAPKPVGAQIAAAVAAPFSDGLKFGSLWENQLIWLANNNRLMNVGDELFLTDGATKLRTWPESDFVLLRPDRQIAVIRLLGLTK